MSATATAFIASAFALPGASDATSLSDKTAEGTWTASVKHDLKVKHIDADEVIKKRTALASKNKADKQTKKQVEKNKISVDDIDDSGTYTVKSGDTLSEIAYEFDISTEDLMEWNDLDSTIIVPGQKLIVVEDAKVEQLDNRETEEVKEKPTPIVTEEKVAQPKVVVNENNKAEENAEREAQAEAERQAEEQAKAEEEAARQAEEDAKAQEEAERAAEEQAQAEEQAKAEEAAREAEEAAEAERVAEEEAQAQEEAQAEEEAERQAEEEAQAEEQAENDQVAEEEAQAEQEAETETEVEADHQAEEETQVQEEPQAEQETETEQEVEVEEVEQPAEEPQQNNTATTVSTENNNEQAQAQQAEQERQAEAERQAKQEQERKAEEERKAKAEQERKAEEERKAKEEQERKAKEQEEAQQAEAEDQGQGISGDLIGTAQSVIGTPYVWGGNQPGGFDCSGFIHWAHKESGNDIGRNSTDGYYNKSYMVDSPQVGDLVFFEGTYRQGISHMGIYVGSGQFIHASSSAGVTVSSVNGPYWGDHFHSYKRFY